MNLLPLTSLPRTGSTLLLYILNQNPIFEIGPDSEIGNLLNYNKAFIQNNIHHFQLPTEKVVDCFSEFCKNGVEGWINQISDPNKIFIDKSRHWLKDLPYIFNLFPDIKILITIRDLRGLINSFEKIHNNSIFTDRLTFHNMATETVGNYNTQSYRVECTLQLDYIRENLFSLKELIECNNKFKDQIKICRYEDLIKNPKHELEQIYSFLNLPNFEHDFDNIDQGPHNDNPYQPYGCHTIKKSINSNATESFSELSDDVSNMIVNRYFWYYRAFYPEVISQ